jgi:hypothetical protein
MSKINKSGFVVVLSMLLFVPCLANAFNVSYLQPGFAITEVLSLELTRAFDFDSAGNLYTSPDSDYFTGTVNIYKFDASTNYSESLYTSYVTEYGGATGISFSKSGNLFVSEFQSPGNSGAIRTIDFSTGQLTGTTTVLSDFRPSGISNDSNNVIYVTGRKSLDDNFGNIYRNPGQTSEEIVVKGFAGKGIALDDLGNIFASTRDEDATYGGKSIVRFPSGSSTSTVFATFDRTAGELSFDDNGNLFAIFNNDSGGSTIYKIAPVPIPAAVWLLGSGIVGLAALRRKVQK